MNKPALSLIFYKYQGAGNDFILLDNRAGNLQLSQAQIAVLCHRRFGIGADGLMLLEETADYDFYMRYYNSDGAESSMCGNGGRCITAFAHRLGIIQHKAFFLASDGPHEAMILPDGWVRLGMTDVPEITREKEAVILHTGSPHYVCFRQDVTAVDVVAEGRRIRRLPRFMPGGINVNFVTRTPQGLNMRTYERGVEDETFACGTGATAAAIAASEGMTGSFETSIQTPGGALTVAFFKPTPTSAVRVFLTGPATFVFAGTINVP